MQDRCDRGEKHLQAKDPCRYGEDIELVHHALKLVLKRPLRSGTWLEATLHQRLPQLDSEARQICREAAI